MTNIRARQFSTTIAKIVFGVTVGLGAIVSAARFSATASELPPNFRAIIRANLESVRSPLDLPSAKDQDYPPEINIFPNNRQVTDVEISKFYQRTQTILYGWAWQTCMRATVCWTVRDAPKEPLRLACLKHNTFAIFIEQSRVVSARSAIVADHCDQENYVSLKIRRKEQKDQLPDESGSNPQ